MNWNIYGDRTPDKWGYEPWLEGGTDKKQEAFVHKGIAISGKIASGKTTLAEYVSDKYGLPRWSLAGALKLDVSEALYMAGLEADQESIMNMKGRLRTILQEWGTLFKEVNGEDYWVEQLFKSAGPGPFVCDDMRFPNELDAFQRRGFLCVRLECGPWDQLKRVEQLYPTMKLGQLKHLSETALDGSLSRFDVVMSQHILGVDAIHEWWDVMVAPRFSITTGLQGSGESSTGR